MSLDASVTVNGWIGTQPRYTCSDSGVELTTFRLASTKRFFNRNQQEWVDGPTTWFTVKCWRGTAKNVAESLRKSDAVIVRGSLSVETWEGPEGPRTTVVIDAEALGPDLSRGMGSFRHVERRKEEEPAVEAEPIDISGLSEAPEDPDPAEDSLTVTDPAEDSLTVTEETETREPVSA